MCSSHAVASLWFVKWVAEQQNTLQQILLCSPIAEVREVFANLLTTNIAVTVRNEEHYLHEFE
jgi:hypothetical protein